MKFLWCLKNEHLNVDTPQEKLVKFQIELNGHVIYDCQQCSCSNIKILGYRINNQQGN